MAPGHCRRIKKNESIAVVGENNGYREIERADGSRVWASWAFLFFNGH